MQRTNRGTTLAAIGAAAMGVAAGARAEVHFWITSEDTSQSAAILADDRIMESVGGQMYPTSIDLTTIHHHGTSELDPTDPAPYNVHGGACWIYDRHDYGVIRFHPYFYADELHELYMTKSGTGRIDPSNVMLYLQGMMYGDGDAAAEDDFNRFRHVTRPSAHENFGDMLGHVHNPFTSTSVPFFQFPGVDWGQPGVLDITDLVPLGLANSAVCDSNEWDPPVWTKTPWAEVGIEESHAWMSDVFDRLAYRFGTGSSAFTRLVLDEEHYPAVLNQQGLQTFNVYRGSCDGGAPIYTLQSLAGAGSTSGGLGGTPSFRTLGDLHADAIAAGLDPDAPYDIDAPFADENDLRVLANRAWADWYWRVTFEAFEGVIDQSVYVHVRENAHGLFTSTAKVGNYNSSMKTTDPHHYRFAEGNWGGQTFATNSWDGTRKIDPETNEWIDDPQHFQNPSWYPRAAVFFHGTEAEAQAAYEAWLIAHGVDPSTVNLASWRTDWDFVWDGVCMPYYRHNLDALVNSLDSGESPSEIVPFLAAMGARTHHPHTGAQLAPTLTWPRMHEQLELLRSRGLDEIIVWGNFGGDGDGDGVADTDGENLDLFAEVVAQLWQFEIADVQPVGDLTLDGTADDLMRFDGAALHAETVPGTGSISEIRVTLDAEKIASTSTSFRLMYSMQSAGAPPIALAFLTVHAATGSTSQDEFVGVLDVSTAATPEEQWLEFSVDLGANETFYDEGQATFVIKFVGDVDVDIDLIQLVEHEQPH